MMKKQKLFTVNLTEIEGDGSFPCPKCGTLISPDDESEEVYEIIETKMENNVLVGLVVSCRTCKTVIELTGFEQVVKGLASE